MFQRNEIRYGRFWVRLLCCIAVAIAVANLVHFEILEAVENVARDIVLGMKTQEPLYVSVKTEIIIVLLVCIAVSILRIERPVMLVGFGIAFTLVYVLVVLLTAMGFNLVIPVTSSLLGIFGSTVFLETMAWSEERSKRKELELLETAKQRFTDMLVHDLRRRMSTILISFSVFEKKTTEVDEKTKGLITTIRASAERMLIHVNDLLAIRKIEEGKMVLHKEDVLLGTILQASLEEHRPVSDLVGVGINLEGEGEAIINVDTNILERVMANLLWNALEHSPAQSEIEVGYSLVADGDVEVYVANRGDSIPRDQQKTLFQAFVSARKDSFTGNVPSMGLGLAFCKLAIEAHGGSVSLETPWVKNNDGVKVVIKIPASTV